MSFVVLNNEKRHCMKFTVGQTSDSLMTLAHTFHRWVSAWSLSLAGPRVAQLAFFFSSDCL